MTDFSYHLCISYRKEALLDLPSEQEIIVEPKICGSAAEQPALFSCLVQGLVTRKREKAEEGF